MPLEATMLIIDNSEWMRNGDYVPTRFDAQSDAVNVVFQTKIDSNPENTVGIMTMAGKSPEVLVTHTKDLGQILGGIHKASSKIGGEIDIPTALAVAQLALKHRENKNLRQRIIVFVGSPLGEGEDKDEGSMVRLAKKLKKNNVAVDIVAFGDGIDATTGEPYRALKAFAENINSGDNSHLVSIPPGTHLLSDMLISSPILSADRSASIPEALGGTGEGPSTTGGANEFEFGVDPSLDPELAMALRMSMQEAQAREAAEAAAASSESTSTPAPPTNSTTTAPPAPAPSTTTTSIPTDPTDDEEEALLQQALAMSQQQEGDVDVDMEDGEEEGDGEEGEEEEEDEDAAIARAIEMSMQTHEEEQKKSGGKK